MSDLEEYIKIHNEECEELMNRIPDGPWKDEPHRVSFKHAGLDCIVKRVPTHGAWCGYVSVSKNHALYGKTYDGLSEDGIEIEVHYGLNYSEKCGGTVCHSVAQGEDEAWWFGFDCCHSGDLAPSYEHMMSSFRLFNIKNHYWTVDEVIAETKSLAEQLKGKE